MKYWTLIVVFLLGSCCAAVVSRGQSTQKITPTQKTVPMATQKTVAAPTQKTVPMGDPTQKMNTVQKSGGYGGMWVYIDASTLAQVRELEFRQKQDCLIGSAVRSVVINCIKKKLGEKLEQLIPDGPPIPIPGPGNGGPLAQRRAQRQAARGVVVRAPFTRVEVQQPQYSYALPPADSQLPPPPDIQVGSGGS